MMVNMKNASLVERIKMLIARETIREMLTRRSVSFISWFLGQDVVCPIIL